MKTKDKQASKERWRDEKGVEKSLQARLEANKQASRDGEMRRGRRGVCNED